MLNIQQQQFYDKVMDLDFTKVFLLGEAGCGKTYLLCKIANEFAELGFNIIFASPTHTAKQIIRDNLGPATKVQTCTVASLLGRAMLRGSEGERFSLPPSLGRKLRACDIFIVDECSMIGEKEAEVFMNPNLNDKNMIFTGDPNQLPPVMQKSGKLWDKMETFTLTIQMRQTTEVYELAKKNITDFIIPQHSSNSIKVSNDEETLRKTFLDTISSAENPLDYLYLAYTNKEVDNMADKVHKALYGEEPFNIGQHIKLGINTKIASKGSEVEIIDVEKQDEPYNGLEYYKVIIEFRGDIEELNVLDPSLSKKHKEMCDKKLSYLKYLLKREDKALVKEVRRQLDELEDFFTPTLSPYCLTIHKSQGTTKKYVWVMSSTLMKAPNKKNLAYVAISRAQEQLHLNYVAPKIKIKCLTNNQILKNLKANVGNKCYNAVKKQMQRDPKFTLVGKDADFYRNRFINALVRN